MAIATPRKTVSFITVCKNRLDHIKQTLPTIVAQAPHEVIVVDYGCPQNVGDWVRANHPSVKVVDVFDDAGFCVARGRNKGAEHATGDWLCFIDGDIRLAPGFTDWVQDNAHPSFYYRAERREDGTRDVETWGTVVMTRKAYDELGGYDEVFRGWGGEDDDIYERLQVEGYPEMHFPNRFVAAINHDDELRVVYHEVKTKTTQMLINRVYRDIKKNMMGVGGKDYRLPMETRQAIWRMVVDKVSKVAANPQMPRFVLDIEVDTSMRLNSEFDLKRKCLFTFEMHRKGQAAPAQPRAAEAGQRPRPGAPVRK